MERDTAGQHFSVIPFGALKNLPPNSVFRWNPRAKLQHKKKRWKTFSIAVEFLGVFLGVLPFSGSFSGFWLFFPGVSGSFLGVFPGVPGVLYFHQFQHPLSNTVVSLKPFTTYRSIVWPPLGYGFSETPVRHPLHLFTDR